MSHMLSGADEATDSALLGDAERLLLPQQTTVWTIPLLF